MTRFWIATSDRSVAGTVSQNRGMHDREGVATGPRNRRLGDDLEHRQISSQVQTLESAEARLLTVGYSSKVEMTMKSLVKHTRLRCPRIGRYVKSAYGADRHWR